MPNLKDIRRRIKSVKNTQKITQAMRMVAAAKVKRSEARVKAARPYGAELQKLFGVVYREVARKPALLDGSPYKVLLKPRAIKNIGIVVMSSDRGLCGAYNSSIIRQTLKLEKALIEKGYNPKFYLVGSKIVQAFNRYGQSEVLGRMSNMTAAPTVADANLIADRMSKAFLDGEIDSIEIFSTHFVSMISYKVKMASLIPVRDVDADGVPDLSRWAEPVSYDNAETGAQSELQLEPNPAAVLDQLVPQYLSYDIYVKLLEAAASELAARMTAMQSATKNAAAMIDSLTVQYNKARQSSITQEILEVVSGAEALR